MAKLLIVCNTPSKNTRLLFDASLRGARDKDLEQVNVRALEPLQASADDVIWADGIIIGSTENFGAMSGLIKDFLERIYYPCLESERGLPAALYVRAGLDGEGARIGMEKVLAGLGWKLVMPTIILSGDFQKSFITDCEQLGLTMAAGLEAGIF